MKLTRPDFSLKQMIRLMKLEHVRKMMHDFVASEEETMEVHLELTDEIRSGVELYDMIQSVMRKAKLDADKSFGDVRVFYAPKEDRVYLYRD